MNRRIRTQDPLAHKLFTRPDAHSIAVATAGWLASLTLFVIVTAGVLSAPLLPTLSVAVGQWLMGLPLLLGVCCTFR